MFRATQEKVAQCGAQWVQDLGVSLAGARGRILLPSIDKNSIFILSFPAVPPARGPGRGWQSHVSAGSRGGSGSTAPTRVGERGAFGEGERELPELLHPFPATAGRAEAQGMLVGVLMLGRRGERKGWREQNLLWGYKKP